MPKTKGLQYDETWFLQHEKAWDATLRPWLEDTFHRDGSAFDYLESTPVEVPTMTLRDAGERSGFIADLAKINRSRKQVGTHCNR